MKSLSYSSWNEYITCPRKYKNRKRDNIVDDKIASALIFGKVLDDCLNALILKEPLPSVTVALKCLVGTKHSFYKNDFDYDLVNIELQNMALQKAIDNGYSGGLSANDLYNAIWSKIMDNGKDYNCISEGQQEFISEMCYYSLVQKANLMISAYEDKIIPMLSNARVQVECTSRSGFIDVIANVEGYGPCLIDNKTSSRRYKQSDVDFSPQLLNYAHDQNMDRVMYIVLVKQIKKNKEKECVKCKHQFTSTHKSCPNLVLGNGCGGDVETYINPECDIQIISSDVNKIEQKEVVESFKEVGDLIQKDVFPKNLKSCANQFGKPCIYYNYCRNGSMKNLKNKGE